MKKNVFHNKRTYRWPGIYLALDRMMSGKFWKLFCFTSIVSILIFLAIGFLANVICNWEYIETFTQMTNPVSHISEKDTPYDTETEWILIYISNIFGIFILNGILLTLLINWVTNRRLRHSAGQARYKHIFKHRYALIYGSHNAVASLANQLLQENNFVIIQTRRDPNEVRKEINAAVKDHNLAANAIIYSGSRTSPHEVMQLRPSGASIIYIIGETSSIDRDSHDSLNMQCWEILRSNISASDGKAIDCHIMFEYQSTFKNFQYINIGEEDSTRLRFIPFSIYENWAQQVLLDEPQNGVYKYLPLEGDTGLAPESMERVHLIIIGMSKMGIAMALEAAHLCHYPNFNNSKTGRPRTLITFIDRNARREMMFTMGRYKELFNLARWRYIKAPDEMINPNDDSWNIYDRSSDIGHRCAGRYHWNDPIKDPDLHSPYQGDYLGGDIVDIDFEFIEGDVALPSIQKYIADSASDTCLNNKVKNTGSRTTIAVCLPVSYEALSVALNFEATVYSDIQQIWVQQQASDALLNAIKSSTTGIHPGIYSRLRPFGMLNQCDYHLRQNSLMPRIVAYTYACMNSGTTIESELYKANSREEFLSKVTEHWHTLGQSGGKSKIAAWNSNIYCANTFRSKARCLNLDMTDSKILNDKYVITTLAHVEHNRWIMEQLLLGMRPLDRSYADRIPLEDKQERNDLKSRGIHPDILSNGKLGSTSAYDCGIVATIPFAMALATTKTTSHG